MSWEKFGTWSPILKIFSDIIVIIMEEKQIIQRRNSFMDLAAEYQ